MPNAAGIGIGATMIIGGQRVDGARTLEVIDPSTGAVFACCACADEAQLDAAVVAARGAFRLWSETPLEKRADSLAALADRVHEQADELAALLTREQGKPIPDALEEIFAAVAAIRYYAAQSLSDELLCDEENARIIVRYASLGVVAIITPWNSPVLMLANKLAPALLAGNTVVAKPAASTPLTTLAIGALCNDLFPPGVVNVIVDRNDLGDRLTGHPQVDKISFTGSTETGRRVAARAASGLKRMTLELGGNDAAIVLDDADVSMVAPQILRAAMRNSGQVCMAAKRVYVPAALYEEMCQELADLAASIVVGNGSEDGVQMGPIQNRAQYQKVLRYLAIAARDGKIVAGGSKLEGPGYFVRPTIVRDISPESLLVQEEQFGPILPVIRYEDLDDLVEQVNATPFGLAGSVWCTDVARGQALAARIDSGIVWVNKYLDLRFDVAIGGVKASGVGLELGRDGLLSYTQRTVINSPGRV